MVFIRDGLDHAADLIGLDPMLAILKTGPGGLPARLPLPGSPAIDAGDADFVDLPETDQRGLARVEGVAPDIGAVEVLYAISAATGTPQTAALGTAFPEPLAALVTERGFSVLGAKVEFTAPAEGASAIFQAGTAMATVTTNSFGLAVTPTLTASGEEGNYLVTAMIGGSDQAAIFSLSNTPNPFASWIAYRDFSGDDALPLANPAFDGIANLLKYAFNLDPTRPDVRRLAAGIAEGGALAGLPLPQVMEDGRLRLYFIQPEGDTGIVLVPLFSDDLSPNPDDWTPQYEHFPVPGRTAGGYQLRYADDPETEPRPRRFGIILVNQSAIP